jgi:SPP1 gp7 family putative phage head morphogenesis protein
MLVRGISPRGRLDDVPTLVRALQDYSSLLTPWARSVAGYMLADTARRNERQWMQHAKEMGRALRTELTYAPTGALLQEMLEENVSLIKSLPLEAAKRVHEYTLEGLVTSTRAEQISKEILATGEVSEARARLIARTEVARTAAKLTEARARYVGSEGYIWRTSKDGRVRDTHQSMEGKYVPWSDPPKTDKNLAPYHAGCGPNCRCYAEPILPDF